MTAVFYPQTGVSAELTGKVTGLFSNLDSLQRMLGGELEVLQLGDSTCLLTNAQAKTQYLPKNKEASQLWFDKHPQCGASADFIHGAVIHCASEDVAALNHLACEVKPVLTAAERHVRRMVTPAEPVVAEALVCSMEEGCLSCGS